MQVTSAVRYVFKLQQVAAIFGLAEGELRRSAEALTIGYYRACPLSPPYARKRPVWFRPQHDDPPRAGAWAGHDDGDQCAADGSVG